MDTITTTVIEALGGEVEACGYDIPAIVAELRYNIDPTPENIREIAPAFIAEDPDA